MFAHDHTMTTKRVFPQGIHIRNQFGPQRIQMNVAHQFEQIGIFLAQDRFVPVLEQVPMAAVVPLKVGLKLTAWPVNSRRIKVAIGAAPVRSSR